LLLRVSMDHRAFARRSILDALPEKASDRAGGSSPVVTEKGVRPVVTEKGEFL
jgi:hypothetical protein